MEVNQTNTEQSILAAAEQIFIQKGFAATRCMEIAAAAGVNHAMLHYYFRTKEVLFNQIFEKKAAQLLNFFVKAFDSDLPFFEKLQIGIETHFDFLVENPRLPLFVFREIIQSQERKQFILQQVFPIGMELLKQIERAFNKEEKKGGVRPVKFFDLLLNIGSLNVFAFVAAQIFFDVEKDRENPEYQKFLNARKKNNVEIIINSLKIQ
ncbi:MAG: TetR/AcrR family transcriptional regulator [Candidatus Symbiothrix sp.]|jgi:AcrR family transcriptional regulator|nr:TetR/AcrR family transcriptional regulator [Candidatus Symbiothrix sp.]